MISEGRGGGGGGRTFLFDGMGKVGSLGKNSSLVGFGNWVLQ